jgi:hypothetical protein
VEPVKPPADPVVKLASDTPAVVEVKSQVAAPVETIATAGPIKQGDVVVKLTGYKPIAIELAAAAKEIDRVTKEVKKGEDDLAAAETAGIAAKVTTAKAYLEDRQKSLADKQALRDTKQAQLDKLVLKAPAAGELTPIAKVQQRVAIDAPLFSIAPSTMLVATFKPDAAKPDTNVFVAVKGSEQKVTCRVTGSDATGTKVACPHDASLDGAEVTLAGEAPAVALEPEKEPEKAPEPPKVVPKKQPPIPLKQPPPKKDPPKDPAPEKPPAETPPAETPPAPNP